MPHECIVRSCRVCGCTDDNACYDSVRRQPCHWVDVDLCSACEAPAQPAHLVSGTWNEHHTVWTSKDGRFEIARLEHQWVVTDKHNFSTKPEIVVFKRYSGAREYVANVSSGNVLPLKEQGNRGA